MQRWKCLCTVLCGDCKLNPLVEILERGDCRAHYRHRNYGLPSRWNDYADHQHELQSWYGESIGFNGAENPPVTGSLVLQHTNCAAVHKNVCFSEIRARRHQFPSTPNGEMEFCLAELRLIQAQTNNLKSPSSLAKPFGWYFGAVDTDRVESLTHDSTLHDAAACITWLDGMPEFFAKRLAQEAVAHTHGRRHHNPSDDIHPLGGDLYVVHQPPNGHPVVVS